MSTLCTVEQVKSRNNIANSDTDDEGQIVALIDVVEARFIDVYGREFAPFASATTRTFKVKDDTIINLDPWDLRSATTVTLHPEAESALQTVLVAGTDYTLLPVDTDHRTSTYTQLELADTFTVTGSDFNTNFGYSKLSILGEWGIWNDVNDVDAVVNNAAIITVISLLEGSVQELAAYGVEEATGLSPRLKRGWDIPFPAHQQMDRFLRHSEIF